LKLDKEVYKYTGQEFDINQELKKDNISIEKKVDKVAKETKKSDDTKKAPVKKAAHA